MKRHNSNSSNNEISGVKMTYPKSTLHKLFADRAEMFPSSVALEFNDEKVTYDELGKQINQIAHYLWNQGLRPGQVVAISLDRSPELIASLFAILQCGASYVPIDTMYPDARLNLIIEDAAATFHIGLTPIKNVTNNVVSLSINVILNNSSNLPTIPLNVNVATESAAYIIYTSGSTGKPKGVQVAHCNVINLVYSMANEPGINETDKIFSVTTISFDAMVMEIYLPLLFGACVVLVDEDTRMDGKLLMKKAVKDKITVLWGTPSIWQILLDSGWEQPLKIKALIGGEMVPMPLAHKLLSKCDELWNIYGPTETTVCSFLTQITLKDDPITIGLPIANTNVYLLDADRNPVKHGDIGEIVIAGDGVSLGYLNRPELTNERFIPNTFNDEDHGNMYLSGDLGKLLPNGHVQCLGRIDHQVKVRGYRIEIGEIEHTLMSIEGIKTAVVLVKTDILVAFFVAEADISEDVDLMSLCKNHLTSQLPAFMIPQIFHEIEKIPTTSNDKIDRKALLEQLSHSESTKIYTAPRSEEEKLVSTIWKENLNIDKIDIFSDFFELGGHSIKAVKIISDIEKHTGKRISLPTLFEHSTIEKFAKLLQMDNDIYADCLVPLKSNGHKNPIFMVHGGGLNVLSLVNMSKHFDEDQPFYAIQGVGPKGYDDWYESIEAMAAHYIDAIVKVNPKGPYALAGFCIGGVVAFEMTRQLKQQGKEVSMTVLLDSYVDSSYFYKTLKQKKLAKYFQRTHRRLNFLKEMLLSRKAIMARINSKKEYLHKKHFNHDNNVTEQEKIAQEQFEKAVTLVYKIIDRYHLKPQDYKVDLIRSKNHPAHTLAPSHLGWGKVAKKGVKIHHIPGDNFDIRETPHDHVLARIIQGISDEKHAYI